MAVWVSCSTTAMWGRSCLGQLSSETSEFAGQTGSAVDPQISGLRGLILSSNPYWPVDSTGRYKAQPGDSDVHQSRGLEKATRKMLNAYQARGFVPRAHRRTAPGTQEKASPDRRSAAAARALHSPIRPATIPLPY